MKSLMQLLKYIYILYNKKKKKEEAYYIIIILRFIWFRFDLYFEEIIKEKEKMNVFKGGFDIISNNRLVKNLIGDNGSCSSSDDMKERLIYLFNLAIIFMINLYKVSYAFMLNLVDIVFSRIISKEKILNKEIVLITGSGGYLGFINFIYKFFC